MIFDSKITNWLVALKVAPCKISNTVISSQLRPDGLRQDGRKANEIRPMCMLSDVRPCQLFTDNQVPNFDPDDRSKQEMNIINLVNITSQKLGSCSNLYFLSSWLCLTCLLDLADDVAVVLGCKVFMQPITPTNVQFTFFPSSLRM